MIRIIKNLDLYNRLLERVKAKEWIEDKFLLGIANKYGWTIAHEQAKRGWITEDKEVLKLADDRGWTVAHEQASHGWVTNDKEILKLATVKGLTVAHIQARNGWTTEDKEILKLATKEDGWTVAHEQASRGWITEDKEILKLVESKYNISVAHFVAQSLAENGRFFYDKEILKLANCFNWTVAHEQACYGWITVDEEILGLADNNGNTVCSIIIEYWSKRSERSIDKKFTYLQKVLQIAKQIDPKIEKTNCYKKLNETVANLLQFKSFFAKKIKERTTELSKSFTV